MTKTHILLFVPDSWETSQKGKFYEDFISKILRPMRYKVFEQLRFTGMEIDLLAKGEDQPRTVLVECKALRDPLPADVISKLIGNVAIRKADEGWLFSTSDLTKDGRAQWEDIQNDPDLRKKFTWYSPARIVSVLITQKSIIDPLTLTQSLFNCNSGDWTLVIAPHGNFWLVELIEDGIPTRYSVFDAKSGNPIDFLGASKVVEASPRFGSLQYQEIIATGHGVSGIKKRAPVAHVISGDSWDDPRPARPIDFVGRDDIIGEITDFMDKARIGNSSTRTFAIIGPSGWGKSSLILKIVDVVKKRSHSDISVTPIDTRSATSSAFVSESIRLAFLEAAEKQILPANLNFNISSLRDPLESPDYLEAIEHLKKHSSCIILIFDQFEELFAREELFEIFNAVRELSLDIDARQVPIILGFAWKTDISLPQQHPAYHLWHQLADRRRTFNIREFGSKDIKKIINRGQRAIGKTLSQALKNRLLEQCQGFPWLLKKLLVHVLQRVSTTDSQYLLLERELDIEQLFREDLSLLGEEHIRCLKYVALKGPIATADVESNFAREITNHLINNHLLVRSGMNYVIYWDIFKDYLSEDKVPYIPWARTFQRGPAIALKALPILAKLHSATAPELAKGIKMKEVPCINLLADLVALQLVELDPNGRYCIAKYLDNVEPPSLAKFVQGQFRRHVVVKEIVSKWEKGNEISSDKWISFFSHVHPRTSELSKDSIRAYAGNLKNWLLFAGILEQRNNLISRPEGESSGMGILPSARVLGGTFLGSASPKKLEQLLEILYHNKEGINRSTLEQKGLRNAIYDGVSLGLLLSTSNKAISLKDHDQDLKALLKEAKSRVLQQKTISIIQSSLTDMDVGIILQEKLGSQWQSSSVKRYLNGLRRYLQWAKNTMS